MCKSAVTKNAKNSQVCSHGKMTKTFRSAFTEKYQKLAGLPARKMLKTHRSAVAEKYQNLAGPRGRKHAKNSQVRGDKKLA